MALYNATNGSNWFRDDNWLTDLPLARWHGVTTDSSGRVTELNLANNRLVGAIPPQFGTLSELTGLSIGDNNISDMSSLALLEKLETLSVRYNRWRYIAYSPAVSPPFTDLNDLAGIASLKRLDITRNNITDIAPLENLANIEWLDFSENHVSDIGPLATMTRLRSLYVARNWIMDIATLAVLSNLSNINLSHNIIADITPLVGNDVLGRGSAIDLKHNPLNGVSRTVHIPRLQMRGVSVSAEEAVVIIDQMVYDDSLFVMLVEEDLGSLSLPLEQYAERFYQKFSDSFDFLIFVPHSLDKSLGGYGAIYLRIRNNVMGIGLDTVSPGRAWGSDARLQGVIRYRHLDAFSREGSFNASDLLHELMHQWANFVLPTGGDYGRPGPGGDSGHWGISGVGAGYLGGLESDVVSRGDGTFVAKGRPRNSDNPTYNSMELYLAGLIPADEVPDFWIAEDPEPLRDSDGYVIATNADWSWGFTASSVVTHTIDDIIAEHGPRVPDASRAQKEFRAAAILLVREDYQPTVELLERLSNQIRDFEHPGKGESLNFYMATGGRGTITISGLSQFEKR